MNQRATCAVVTCDFLCMVFVAVFSHLEGVQRPRASQVKSYMKLFLLVTGTLPNESLNTHRPPNAQRGGCVPWVDNASPRLSFPFDVQQW